jgi:aminoglycoside phosphotransferase (APT) family kinase protein
MSSGSPSAPAVEDRSMQERLHAFLARQEGLDSARLRIRELRRMAGGASREIWSLVLEIDGEGGPCHELVLRRDPPGRAGEGDRSLEFRLLRVAAQAGVPVPRVHWCCSDPDVLGTPFFVMDRVAGETIPRRLLRDARYAAAREKMTRQLAEILVRIHSIDPAHPDLAGLPSPPPGESPAKAEVHHLAAAIRELAVEPHPVLDLAERWLRTRIPTGERRSVVHGDFRVGNVVFDESGALAVLDWELSKVGDPVEDLGWLCTRAWRFGRDELPAGGIGTRAELLTAYRAAGGEEVDPERLRFWEAVGSFKVALVFIQQSRVFLSGQVRSLELASLGRRTAEAEEELLRLLEEDP